MATITAVSIGDDRVAPSLTSRPTEAEYERALEYWQRALIDKVFRDYWKSWRALDSGEATPQEMARMQQEATRIIKRDTANDKPQIKAACDHLVQHVVTALCALKSNTATMVDVKYDPLKVSVRAIVPQIEARGYSVTTKSRPWSQLTEMSILRISRATAFTPIVSATCTIQ